MPSISFNNHDNSASTPSVVYVHVNDNDDDDLTFAPTAAPMSDDDQELWIQVMGVIIVMVVGFAWFTHVRSPYRRQRRFRDW